MIVTWMKVLFSASTLGRVILFTSDGFVILGFCGVFVSIKLACLVHGFVHDC